MKKIIKVLTIASAALITATMGLMPTSAAKLDTIIDPNNLTFSGKISTKTPSCSYAELWIDDNFRWGTAEYYEDDCVIARIPDGSEPPYLEKSETAIKLSKANIAELNSKASWGMFYEIDAKVTDNFYSIRGFKNKEDAGNYRQKILNEGIADYAELSTRCVYGVGTPIPSYVSIDMKNAGIDTTGFDEDDFIITVKTESATEFNAEDIEGLKDNITAITEKDNIVYFQFDKNADTKTVINILKNIDIDKNLELGVANMGILEASISSISNNPHIYAQGDVNRDDKIDIYDAIAIAKYLVGNIEFNEVEMYLADYDENDKVDLYDAICIAKYLIGAK